MKVFGDATRRRVKAALRGVLAIVMAAVGVMHFLDPAPFVAIVPPFLPAPLALVYLSGACEIAGGLGLLPARTRSLAGWGLVALYVAVFPANLHMAIHELPLGGEPVPPALLWARLPLQLVFIGWAWWVSRPDDQAS
jgi:uncharacterized membrane protein